MHARKLRTFVVVVAEGHNVFIIILFVSYLFFVDNLLVTKNIRNILLEKS